VLSWKDPYFEETIPGSKFLAIRRRKETAMLFGRKDFHGGRAYEPELSEGHKSNFETRGSLVIAWVKTLVGKFNSAGSKSAVETLWDRQGEGFTLLGERHGHNRELNTRPFPMPGGRPRADKDRASPRHE